MHDVFISYARAERAKAEPLKRSLEAEGFSIFFDTESIDVGDEFPDRIDKALKSAKAVVACWSKLAFSRPWVRNECRVAKLAGTLVPVAIEEFAELEIPTEFISTHYLKLNRVSGQADEVAWQNLVRRVGGLVQGSVKLHEQTKSVTVKARLRFGGQTWEGAFETGKLDDFIDAFRKLSASDVVPMSKALLFQQSLSFLRYFAQVEDGSAEWRQKVSYAMGALLYGSNCLIEEGDELTVTFVGHVVVSLMTRGGVEKLHELVV